MTPFRFLARGRLPGISTATVVMLALVAGPTSAVSAGGDELGVSVPEGFEVTLFADDDLAHDIYCMAIDSLGRVVVSGKGYVRILEDQDGDGRAETAIPFVDGPDSGAQGLFFYGRDLLCTADGGLIRYRDQDGDDRADGPPEVFLKARTGGEHDIHALRQGPDGWWYVIAGNMAGIGRSYITAPNSPVASPEAGCILRLKPDLTGAEVLADGFRNAYDFDFSAAGDLFTFDSDGERDVSLPWYRPTRVFQVTPGAHAGWLSRSWKRPDAFLDMPPVVASFGRGSPTGVVCYRHTQFPEKYRESLFVLDWTYGRVFAVRLVEDGSTWRSDSETFMASVGQHGFAPTDAAVGPDGSLYVCVGGRGTRGGVYQVRWGQPALDAGAMPDDLTRCLTQAQPLSSWSRSEWEPIARDLGAEPFARAVLEVARPVTQRVRAIEILTEKFQGLTRELIVAISLSRDAEVRTRAAWSIGRVAGSWNETDVVVRFLNDREPRVVRAMLEALLGAPVDIMDQQAEQLARHLASPDRFVRQAAVRVMARLSEPAYHRAAAAAVPFGWQAAISVAEAYALRKRGVADYSIEIGTRILQGEHTAELDYQAARLLQLGLGDLCPASGVDPVFEGYASRVDLLPHEQELNELRGALADIFPTGHRDVDQELARVIAMVQPPHPAILDNVLAQITDESHPTDDIHHLVVAARIPVGRSTEQRTRIARALVELERKIEDRNLSRDSNWQDRLIEMYIALVELDPKLPEAILEQSELGHPGHVLWVLVLPDELRQQAVEKFVSQIREDPDYAWNADVVFLLGESPSESVRDLLREQFADFSLQNSILLNLADRPVARDRPLFIEGLESPDLGVLEACLGSLAELDADANAAEQVALVRTVRRLGSTNEERGLRDRAIALLRRNTGEELGYAFDSSQPQSDALRSWTEWAERTHPAEWTRQTGSSSEELEDLNVRLAGADWEAGDAVHGRRLFEARSCHQCHGSSRALGPDLSGVTGRFSRSDLFTAIALPNRDVSPRYQTTLVATTEGTVRTGLIVYESVDGLVLRTGTNQTFRFETGDIEMQRVLPVSLMPSGLLKDLDPQDLADLYAYLRTLGVQTAEVRETQRSE